MRNGLVSLAGAADHGFDAPLIRNDVWEDPQRVRIRILALDNFRGVVAWMSLASTHSFDAERRHLPALPAWEHIDSLRELLRSGKFRRLTPSEAPSAVVNGLPSKSAIDRSRKRLKLIADLAQNPEIFNKSKRERLIDAQALTACVSRQTIRTCLRLYWQGGQTRDALLPKYHNCGALSYTRNKQPGQLEKCFPPPESGPKSGRRAVKGLYVDPYVYTQAERVKLSSLGEVLYLSSKTQSMSMVYEDLMAEFFSTVDANGCCSVLSPGDRPSLRQVTYDLRGKLKRSDVLKRNSSASGFAKDHAPKLGSAQQGARMVGEVFEMDATQPDVFIVATANRKVIIGKSTMYIIVDRISRLIVGFNLSLAKASWTTASRAIVTMLEDKKALCDRWKAVHKPEAWPATGILPATMVCDRGPENLGIRSDDVVTHDLFDFETTPNRSPHRKGTVESLMKLLQRPLKNIAGYDEPSDQFNRSDTDYKSDAALTLDQLGAELMDAIQEHNLRTYEGFNLHAHDIAEKASKVPVDIWNTGVARDGNHGSGSQSLSYIRAVLLPREKVTVTRQGIHFFGLQYECELGKEEEWFVRQPAFECDARYDSRLVDAIYLLRPGNPNLEPIKATLTAPYKSFLGHTFAEVQLIQTGIKQADELGKEANLARNIEHRSRIRARNKQAKELTGAAIAQDRKKGNAKSRDDKGGYKAEEQSERELREARETLSIAAATEASINLKSHTNPDSQATAPPASKPAAQPLPGQARLGEDWEVGGQKRQTKKTIQKRLARELELETRRLAKLAESQRLSAEDFIPKE